MYFNFLSLPLLLLPSLSVDALRASDGGAGQGGRLGGGRDLVRGVLLLAAVVLPDQEGPNRVDRRVAAERDSARFEFELVLAVLERTFARDVSKSGHGDSMSNGQR